MSGSFADLIPKIRKKREREEVSNLTKNFNDFPAFIDFDMKMIKSPFTNDILLKTHENAITQSIKNLLLNKKFFSKIPINFRQLIFENDEVPFITANLKSKIQTILARHEPRIVLKEVEISKNVEKKILIINIIYELVTAPDNLYRFPIFINIRT